jgi:hypothetical protein
MRFPSPSRIPAATLALIVACCAAACSTALGLSDYSFRTNESDGGALEAGTSIDGSAGAADATERDASAGPDASARADASPSVDAAADAPADVASCDVDLTLQCYPCAPTQTVQFLNACTTATCVPFDDGTRDTHLLPDGALPPLPVNDAGLE